MYRKTVKIGLLAGPGSGKSTLAAGVFTHCKQKGIPIYLVTEFAREEIDRGWKPDSIAEQFRILKEQRLREDSIPEQIKVMITDSPVFFSYFYSLWYSIDHFADKRILLSLYDEFLSDLNRYDYIYIVNRIKPYARDGTREQTKHDSDKITILLKSIMDLHKIPYIEINGDETGIKEIIKVVNFEVG